MRNFVAVGSWVSILWGVKIRHLPLTWLVAVNTVLALPRSLWLSVMWTDNTIMHVVFLYLCAFVSVSMAIPSHFSCNRSSRDLAHALGASLDRRIRKFLEKFFKKIWVEVNHFKIDCSLIVMFFTKLIIVMFTLCLFIVFSLFIMLYVCLLLPFLWWNKDVYIVAVGHLQAYTLVCNTAFSNNIYLRTCKCPR